MPKNRSLDIHLSLTFTLHFASFKANVVLSVRPESQIHEVQHIDLHSPCYHLVGADLRCSKEVRSKLLSCDLDPAAPTLFLSECVLVYMSGEQSENLLTLCAS